MQDQLHLMTVFVAVAEELSFTGASRKLNLSPPAVTRSVASLEAQLGVTLLQRSTRSVRLTDVGTRYLEDSRRVLQQVKWANANAQGVASEPAGLLRITAPVMLGQRVVMPVVMAYLQKFKQAQIEAMYVDRVVNLLEEGFDLAVRIGPLGDSSDRAKPLARVQQMLVAAPSYLANTSQITQPEDLRHHSIICSTAGDFRPTWRFLIGGQERALKLASRLTVADNQSAIIAACKGLGITRVMSYQVEQELASGQLVALLQSFQTQPLPVHIVHREDHRGSIKVRAFIELLSKKFSELGD